LLYGIIVKLVCEIQENSNSTTDPDRQKEVHQSVKKFLRFFSQHVNLVGDDIQGWGLFTALGIGKSSQLSIRYENSDKEIQSFNFSFNSLVAFHFTEVDCLPNALDSLSLHSFPQVRA
jgi:hypothetical protein